MPAPRKTTASLSAQNTFTDAIHINRGDFIFRVNVTAGTPDATISVQRTTDTYATVVAGTATWLDVQQYTASDLIDATSLVKIGTEAGSTQDRASGSQSGAFYRAGIKTGDYTSGTFFMGIEQ